MKSVKDIKQSIKELTVKSSDEIHNRVLGKLLNMLGKSKKQTSVIQPSIWRIIMKSRITKLAATAAVIVAVLIGINQFGGSIDGTSVAYGMVDLPAIVEQAQTIQITGWRYLDDSAIVADKKNERVASNCYIDNRHERLRWSQYGVDKTVDGEIMTIIHHQAKSVRFYKLSDFQQKVWLRKMHDWNFDRAFMSEEELSEFVKVGHETIEGSELDIWERITTWSYPSDREIKLRVWMSPTTGEVRRIKGWQRGEFTNGQWCVTRDKAIKINGELEAGVFEPVVPDTYHLENTKDSAPEYQSLIIAFSVNGGKRSEVRYIFTLENGSVIMAWSTGILLSNDDSATLYEPLEPGRSLPTKPVEIMYGLTPRGKPRYDSSDYDVTFDDTSITYSGRFLAWTVKDDQLCEWAIYIPNKEVDVGEVLHRCDIVIGMDPENRTWRKVKRYRLDNNTMVIYDDEFDTFVLGAMAELSNDGIVPEHVTHENILELAKKLRSLMQ